RKLLDRTEQTRIDRRKRATQLPRAKQATRAGARTGTTLGTSLIINLGLSRDREKPNGRSVLQSGKLVISHMPLGTEAKEGLSNTELASEETVAILDSLLHWAIDHRDNAQQNIVSFC